MQPTFVAPIAATLHLIKLGQLAAIMPSAVHAFTLDHYCLDTHLCWSRKNTGLHSESVLQYQTKGSK